MSVTKLQEIKFNSTATAPSTGGGSIYVDDGTNTGTGEVKMRVNRGSFVDTIHEPEVAIICEEQTATTDGGGYTSGSATTRVLNTTVKSQSWLSLSSNRFTIDGANYPGDYSIHWYAPMFATVRFYSWLVLDPAGTPTDANYGDSCYSPVAAGDAQEYSSGRHYVTLSASTTYEIRSQATGSKTTDGLGVAHNQTGYNSIYTQVVIIRHF